MRNLTTNTENSTQQNLATEPIIIIKIQWASGDQYYGDKTFTLGSISCQGKIIDFSPISSTGKQDSSGEVSTAGIQLDDTDGTLKTIVNTEIIEGTLATVYHHYTGNLEADLVTVLHGKIAGDIRWSEGDRTLAFSIESYIEDAEIGYAPAEGDFVNLSPDAIGVPWPLCFGTVLKVPAVAAVSSPIAHNTGSFFGGRPDLDAMPIHIENGRAFPQSTIIKISIGGALFRGYFDGDLFYRTESNLLWYTNVACADRPPDEPHYYSEGAVWINDSSINLAGKYCYHPDIGFNRCHYQEGNKCYFTNPWPSLLDSSNSFAEVRGVTHSSWFSSPTFFNYWLIYANKLVIQRDLGYNYLHVCNLYPSTEILEVYAYRNDTFVPIPSSYYTKHLSTSLAGHDVTAIEFDEPLSTREGEGWRDEIYVSLRSTLPSNVSDIIKWILQTYTSFSIDTTSFDEVKILTNPYPCGFAIFDQPNILAIIEDIAWQARCALFIRNGIVSIKYLSYDMPSLYDIQKQDVIFKSLNLSFTSTDDLITKLDGKWFEDYSGRPDYEHTLTYKNNVDRFGLKEEEREFFIYNIEELAKMSLYFWGYRYSNSWRILECVSFLRILAFEVYDAVTSTLDIVSTNNIKGVLEELSHDSGIFEIALKLILASKAGDATAGQPVEDTNFWTGDPAYPVQARTIIDPGDGRSEIDYNVPPPADDSDTSSDGDPTAEEFEYRFIIPETTPLELERSTNFTLRIELYDSDGARSYESCDAILSLFSPDASDLLNGSIDTTISLSNGVWESTTQQITGGNGTDFGVISVVDEADRDNYDPAAIEIKIIDIKTGTLTWATEPPASVSRGALFPVSITGGTGGSPETITVTPTLTDSNDKLYLEGGGEITTIELLAGGTYSANWYIQGGEGIDASNVITLQDTLNSKYADSACTAFTITAQTVFNLTASSTFGIAHSVVANAPELELTLIDGILGETFHIGVTLKDSDGNTINHDGTVTLTITDVNDVNINWLTPVAGLVLSADMTAGLALGAGIDCTANVLENNESLAVITASVDYDGETIVGTLDINIAHERSRNQDIEFEQRIERGYTSDLCTGGTAIANYDGVYPASNAFNDSTGYAQFWNTQTGQPVNGVGYIGYHFATSYMIRRFTIVQGGITGVGPYWNVPRVVTSVKFQYSDDGSSWYDAGTFSLIADSSYQINNISDYGSHAYWRLLANSVLTDNTDYSLPNYIPYDAWGVLEVEMMEIT